MAYTLNVNGRSVIADVDPAKPLLWVLREDLGVLGPKYGCGLAQCGACTVHVDGQPVRACITPVSSVGAKRVVTIEAMERDPVGQKVQAAWSEIDVAQCGYCQAGQIMSATALIKSKPKPTDADINAAMQGNLCRCATYTRIRRAIHTAAGNATAFYDAAATKGVAV
jgi:isoquinoline 1-oxidoreductase alpha subunit